MIDAQHIARTSCTSHARASLGSGGCTHLIVTRSIVRHLEPPTTVHAQPARGTGEQQPRRPRDEADNPSPTLGVHLSRGTTSFTAKTRAAVRGNREFSESTRRGAGAGPVHQPYHGPYRATPTLSIHIEPKTRQDADSAATDTVAAAQPAWSRESRAAPVVVARSLVGFRSQRELPT